MLNSLKFLGKIFKEFILEFFLVIYCFKKKEKENRFVAGLVGKSMNGWKAMVMVMVMVMIMYQSSFWFENRQDR